MILAWVRLVLYSLGALFSAMLAGQFLRVNYLLGRMLGIMLLIWSLNCLMLLSLLAWSLITGEAVPAWKDTVITLDAVLLMAAPVIIYVKWPRWENNT